MLHTVILVFVSEDEEDLDSEVELVELDDEEDGDRSLKFYKKL